MSGVNSLINAENEMEGGSYEEMASDLNDANNVAKQIIDEGVDVEK